MRAIYDDLYRSYRQRENAPAQAHRRSRPYFVDSGAFDRVPDSRPSPPFVDLLASPPRNSRCLVCAGGESRTCQR